MFKKCLTREYRIWYYIQAVAEEGGNAKQELGRKKIKNRIRKK